MEKNKYFRFGMTGSGPGGFVVGDLVDARGETCDGNLLRIGQHLHEPAVFESTVLDEMPMPPLFWSIQNFPLVTTAFRNEIELNGIDTGVQFLRVVLNKGLECFALNTTITHCIDESRTRKLPGFNHSKGCIDDSIVVGYYPLAIFGNRIQADIFRIPGTLELIISSRFLKLLKVSGCKRFETSPVEVTWA